MDVSDRIKKIRKEKGLSTYEVATMAGLSQSVVSKLENRKRKADNDTLQKLAEALGVSTDRLTGESVSSLIENRLSETGISLNEVAQKSGVSLHWLKNIDSFIPGEMGDYEIGYDWITKVAEIIGLPGGKLRAALARQEIPTYEGPQISAEEAFRQAQEDFKESYDEPKGISSSDDTGHYYLNDETRQIAQEVFENPELRTLFNVARNISPERLKAHIDLMRTYKERENKHDDEGC